MCCLLVSFSEGDASQEDRRIISLMNLESAYAVENKEVITDCILCHLEHLEGNLCCHSHLSLPLDCLPPNLSPRRVLSAVLQAREGGEKTADEHKQGFSYSSLKFKKQILHESTGEIGENVIYEKFPLSHYHFGCR